MPRRISARAVGFVMSVAAIALLAVACGGNAAPTASGSSSSAATPTATAPASSASSGSVVIKTDRGSAGIWLTDQTGRTLYIYTVDKGTTSACYGSCATAWPPLLATGPVTVNGQFLNQSLVGSTQRTDGTTQVTYGGRPLYYFVGDKSPGQTKGQGLQGVWFIVGPRANIMR